VDGSNDTTRVSGKGPVSGTGSKAQRVKGINGFNMKHVISYPVQVSGFEAHQGTTGWKILGLWLDYRPDRGIFLFLKQVRPALGGPNGLAING